MRRFRIGPRLIAAFLAIQLAVLGAAGVGVWRMGSIKSDATFIGTNSLPAVKILGDLQRGMGGQRLAEYGLITATHANDKVAARDDLNRNSAVVDTAMKEYAPTIVDAKDKEFFDTVTKQLAAYRAASAVALTHPGPVGVEEIQAAETQFAAVEKSVEGWNQYNLTLANGAIARSGSDYSSGRLILILFVATAVALGIALAILIQRSVVRPLTVLRERLAAVGAGDLTVSVPDDGADELTDVARDFNGFAERMRGVMREVAHASRQQIEMAQDMARGAEQSGVAIAEIATTVDEVARGSQDQAAQTGRVNETIAEISEGVRRVAESGESAAEMAHEADAAAGQGSETVQDANRAIQSIQQRVDDAAGIVTELGERSSQVGKIVSTISDIADQTNLLALNAAIEAARAGEQGRGFAVVADEVRKLAESTQQQVGSIAGIIGEIQEHTRRAVEAMAQGRQEVLVGVQRVDDAGAAFETIRDRVGSLSGQVMSVAAAAQQLEAGASEVRTAIGSVAAVSEQNAASVQEVSAATEQTSASAQETAAASNQVAATARDLAKLIEVFQV
ncbi:MAG: methyl-accepting chemotaxis protein [Thermoleophilia bacterium]